MSAGPGCDHWGLFFFDFMQGVLHGEGGGPCQGRHARRFCLAWGGGGLLESMQTQDAFVGKLAWILKCQGLGKWADIEFVFFTDFH